MPHRFQAIVFDLDGTLIDSLPDLTGAVNRLLAEEGLAPLDPDDIKPMIGDGAGTLVRRVFDARGGLPGPDLAPYHSRFLAHYEPRSTELTRPWEGVPETLAALKAQGLKLGVCTNKPTKATHDVLRVLELSSFFDAVVGGDDVPDIKPDPAHVHATLDKLGVLPSAAVMVGDSINDVLAGKGAGLPVVVLSCGYSRIPPAELGADAVIDHFRDLPGAICRL